MSGTFSCESSSDPENIHVPAQQKHLLIFGSSILVRVEVLDGYKYDLFYNVSPENYTFEVYGV